ncbi:MAG TPA: hypothetical protein VFO34_17060 [Candidatus Acidoferrales bacterium]|nr:hypothetical protein [Candidatus Acidoferrales bacterium]
MRTLPVAALIAGTAISAGIAGAQSPANVQDYSTQQSGMEESVAEAARRNREQARAEKTPPRLYTNADIEALGGTIGTVANEPEETQAEAEEAKPEASNALRDSEEKFWRKRFADLRRDIEDTEKEIDILQRELGQTRIQYYPAPIVALREQYSREKINAKVALITEKRLELSILQEQLRDLEDQLRRSGGPAGWSR